MLYYELFIFDAVLLNLFNVQRFIQAYQETVSGTVRVNQALEQKF
jgi:hypothetical protein